MKMINIVQLKIMTFKRRNKLNSISVKLQRKGQTK